MHSLKKHNLLVTVSSLFFISLFSVQCVLADNISNSSQNTNTSLDQAVDSLIQKTLPNVSVGIVLQDVKTGKILYSRRSQEAFPPASTTKLFTAAAALLALGSDYQYKTTLQLNKSTIKEGQLNGDLLIQFSGDPTFSTENLKQLIKDVKSYGINKINGNIIIDNSRFPEPYYSLGWSADSLNWYFAPPITSVIINQNKTKLILNSNKPLGNPVEAAFAPDAAIKLALTSNIKAVTVDDAKTRCQIKVDMNSKNELYLGGCWPVDTAPNAIQVAIKNPTVLAEKLISEYLDAEKIALTGKILTSITPPSQQDFSIVATQTSPPVKELLKPLLLDSNNVYAESLTKSLGAEKYRLGTFQMGVQVIKDTLAQPTGIDFSKLKLFDGSGLSRYNLITPQQFSQLLFAMNQDKKIGSIFRESLPIFGESGSLKARNNDSLKGKFQAKTGSLMGVATLAGYLTSSAIVPGTSTQPEPDKIVVIMIDHALEDSKILDLEHGLCELFLKVPN